MDLDYKVLFESSPDLYLVLKADPPKFTILAVSDSYARTTMTKRENIVGQGIFEVFPDNPKDQAANGVHNLSASLNRVIETKQPDSMAVQKYDIRDSNSGHQFELRYWSPRNIPIVANGEVQYIIHRVEDVTELIKTQNREAEELNRINKMEIDILMRARELQEANEKLRLAIDLREEVLAIVSHDLRNPLGSIEMSTDLLKDSLQENGTEDQFEFIRIIERSLRHMKRLIGDLLSFAKIQSGTLSIEKNLVQIKKLIEDGMQSVQHHAVKKQITFEVQYNSPITEICCDHDRIVEVLSNIFGNAIKFSPPGGVISVNISDSNDELRFEIRDHGPGIPSEHLPFLFDRYWQAKETARQGTGLGLAIAKGIVNSHHGRIEASSILGKGTIMSFTLPLHRKKGAVLGQ